MADAKPRMLRDVLIERIHEKMGQNERIMFLSADFGSPALDDLRAEYGGRFINVGIAEQNLVNVAAGLALEGFILYVYAIAPFLTMRAFEQIRINLALLSHMREINVNLIGVGVGVSYDVTGPTHHCLEDVAIIRSMPNMAIFSFCDKKLVESFVDYSLSVAKPKYVRLDGKPLPEIYDNLADVDFEKGFSELSKGDRVCFISTGFMTHKALHIAQSLRAKGLTPGVVDIYSLNPVNRTALYGLLSRYRCLITMDEAFLYRGGLDSIISDVLTENGSNIALKRFGFGDRYCFDVGDRSHLHAINGLDDTDIMNFAAEQWKVLDKSGYDGGIL
jgi:transketolase